MTARCIAEPISWLKLEGYHLGQLEAAERARVAEHVAACPVCGDCLRSIVEDDARPLPPLNVVRLPLHRRRPELLTLAAAAALLLVARALLPMDDSGSGDRMKGTDVALSLVRGDGARVDGDEGIFRDRDVFEARVTCAPPSKLHFDLVVWDSKGASFPLSAPPVFECGNQRPLPGAFRLTGDEAQTVCLVWEAGPVDRRALAAALPAGERVRCKKLLPAPR